MCTFVILLKFALENPQHFCHCTFFYIVICHRTRSQPPLTTSCCLISCIVFVNSLYFINSQPRYSDAYCTYLYCIVILPPPCAESPPPLPVRVTPRYVVLDTSTDLVLEARFRGNYYGNDWRYNEDDPTFRTVSTSLFSSANHTNVGQTFAISAGSASLRVGYYGPYILPTLVSTIDPTPENTVIVGSFGKYVHCKLTPHSSQYDSSNRHALTVWSQTRILVAIQSN